jgi:hypothetical protein
MVKALVVEDEVVALLVVQRVVDHLEVLKAQEHLVDHQATIVEIVMEVTIV